MNIRIISLLIILVGSTLTGFSKPVKVEFTYNVENVSIIYNDLVYKECPKKVQIDFELGGQIVAFKPGYESQIIKVSTDNVFNTYSISLKPLENKFSAGNLQLELKKASFISFVTNFTPEEVTEIISSKLNQCGIDTYSQNSVFKNAKVGSKKFSIGVEVLNSTNKNGAYTSPYYLLSHQKLKWYVLDNASNTILYESVSEGLYLAYFKANRGMVATARLKEITILSLEEATQKFINSPEFSKLVLEGSNQ